MRFSGASGLTLANPVQPGGATSTASLPIWVLTPT